MLDETTTIASPLSSPPSRNTAGTSPATIQHGGPAGVAAMMKLEERRKSKGVEAMNAYNTVLALLLLLLYSVANLASRASETRQPCFLPLTMLSARQCLDFNGFP